MHGTRSYGRSRAGLPADAGRAAGPVHQTGAGRAIAVVRRLESTSAKGVLDVR